MNDTIPTETDENRDTEAAPPFAVVLEHAAGILAACGPGTGVMMRSNEHGVPTGLHLTTTDLELTKQQFAHYAEQEQERGGTLGNTLSDLDITMAAIPSVEHYVGDALLVGLEQLGELTLRRTDRAWEVESEGGRKASSDHPLGIARSVRTLLEPERDPQEVSRELAETLEAILQRLDAMSKQLERYV